MRLEEFETVFLSGKGGVGKSTVSSAMGVFFSEKGFRTLVISLDPAHSLSLTFKKEIGEKPKKLSENLYAVEVDLEREARRYLERVKREARELLSPVVIGEIEKQIELSYYSPGALDLATTDVIYRLAVSEREFERVVFDTAPSGYTVRMLTSPELTEEWFKRLIKLRKEALKYRKMVGEKLTEKDPVLRILERRLKEVRELRELLLSPKTLIGVVVNPQSLPIEIGRRTVEELSSAGIEVKLIVGNKILKEDERNLIKKTFPKISKVFTPKLNREPKGIETLRELTKFFKLESGKGEKRVSPKGSVFKRNIRTDKEQTGRT